MKKLIVMALAVLMLVSCVTFVSADSPRRVVITDGGDVTGWSNNSKPFAESNVPDPELNADLDDYPVVSFQYTGAVFTNGGWQREDPMAQQGMKIDYKAEEPFDLTGMNYFIFDVYISKADVLRNVKLYMELSSGGGPDKEETGFNMTFEEMKGEPLVDGWNHIELALSSSNSKYGDPTVWSAWNYMRIYNGGAFDAGEGLTVAFKNLYFSEVSPKADQAEAAAKALLDLYAPLAEIGSGDITADNYETVKSQLAAAIAAFNAADGATQAAVSETYDAPKIERVVQKAIEKYEATLNAADTPTDTPADTDEPVEEPADKPEDETTTDTPDVDAPATDTPATEDNGAADTEEPAENNGMMLYLIIGGVLVVAVIVVVVVVATKKKK